MSELENTNHRFIENSNLEDNNLEKKVCMDTNQQSWNGDTYDAWVNRFGEPREAFQRINKDPVKILSTIYSKFEDVKGKKIMNLMGSNGTKAVALSLLGAKVTVVDFSEGNQQYAIDLAKEANVELQYILSDVLNLKEEELSGDYDIVFAEMGILHYFVDLKPFLEIVNKLLKEDGTFVIRDFHPIPTKLLSSRGSTAKVRKHKVTGDYFSTELVEKEVAYSKYSKDEEEAEKVMLRLWTLGEIITAIAKSELVIKSFDEEPNLSSEVFDKGIPKTFTIAAKKPRKVEG